MPLLRLLSESTLNTEPAGLGHSLLDKVCKDGRGHLPSSQTILGNELEC